MKIKIYLFIASNVLFLAGLAIILIDVSPGYLSVKEACGFILFIIGLGGLFSGINWITNNEETLF